MNKTRRKTEPDFGAQPERVDQEWWVGIKWNPPTVKGKPGRAYVRVSIFVAGRWRYFAMSPTMARSIGRGLQRKADDVRRENALGH